MAPRRHMRTVETAARRSYSRSSDQKESLQGPLHHDCAQPLSGDTDRVPSASTTLAARGVPFGHGYFTDCVARQGWEQHGCLSRPRSW